MLRPTNNPESIGLGVWGDALGDSAGSSPEEVTVGSWPGAARVGEVRAPLAPGEPQASFGLEGFGGSGTVLSA
jgi:hypothetical protein